MTRPLSAVLFWSAQAPAARPRAARPSFHCASRPHMCGVSAMSWRAGDHANRVGCDVPCPARQHRDGQCPAGQSARVETDHHLPGSGYLPRSASFTGHAPRSAAAARDRPSARAAGTPAGNEAQGRELRAATTDRPHRAARLAPAIAARPQIALPGPESTREPGACRNFSFQVVDYAPCAGAAIVTRRATSTVCVNIGCWYERS